MFRLLFLIFTIFSLNTCFLQEHKFELIRSKGEFPKQLTRYISLKKQKTNKLLYNKTKLKKRQIKILDRIPFEINDIIYSGAITYGDTLSNYARNIAKKLLNKDSILLDNLLFVSVKSNTTIPITDCNGIIFIPTGVFAIIENECEIAFIIAREISKYKLQIVPKRIAPQIKIFQLDKAIQYFANYSKKNNLLLDKMAYNMCIESGYHENEIRNLFLKLNTILLPIDTLRLSSAFYYDSSFVSKDFFPDPKYYQLRPTNANTNHKYLLPRYDALFDTILGRKYVVNSNSKIPTINYLNTLEKIESVRIDVLNANYINAIYTIYVLRNQQIVGKRLDEFEAKCWYGIAAMKTLPESNRIDGKYLKFHPIYSLYNFEDNFETIPLCIFASKKILDLYKKDSSNLYIKQYFEFSLQNIVWNNSDKVTLLVNRFGENITEEKKESILDLLNIKVEKEENDLVSYYGDLLQIKSLLIEQLKDSIYFEKFNTSCAERPKSTQVIDSKSILVFEPYVKSYRFKKFDVEKRNQTSKLYFSQLSHYSKLNGLDVETISYKDFLNLDANGFNELNYLMTYKNEAQLFKGVIKFLPTDYEEIANICSKYNTYNLLFTTLNYRFTYTFEKMAWVSTLFTLPFPITGVLYFPTSLINYHNLNLSTLLVNGKNGKIYYNEKSISKESDHKIILESKVYHLFNTLTIKAHK